MPLNGEESNHFFILIFLSAEPSLEILGILSISSVILTKDGKSAEKSVDDGVGISSPEESVRGNVAQFHIGTGSLECKGHLASC